MESVVDVGQLDGWDCRPVGAANRSERAPARRQPSEGLGQDVRLEGPGIVGSGLEMDGEVLQVTAYVVDQLADPQPSAARATHIARPTRRGL